MCKEKSQAKTLKQRLSKDESARHDRVAKTARSNYYAQTSQFESPVKTETNPRKQYLQRNQSKTPEHDITKVKSILKNSFNPYQDQSLPHSKSAKKLESSLPSYMQMQMPDKTDAQVQSLRKLIKANGNQSPTTASSKMSKANYSTHSSSQAQMIQPYNSRKSLKEVAVPANSRASYKTVRKELGQK